MNAQTENQIDDQNGNKSKPLLSIVRVRDYRCPKCKQIHNDDENGYWYNK